MTRLIIVPGSGQSGLGGIPAPTLTAVPQNSTQILLTASYTGPPALATYTFQTLLPPYPVTLATQASPTFLHNGVTPGVPYLYRVDIQTSESPPRSSMWSAIVEAATVPTPPLVISTASLANATVNVAYSAQFAGMGGTIPYSWELVSTTGSNAWTLTTGGLLTGTPTTGQIDQITVQLTDSTIPTPQVVTKTLPLTVIAATAGVVTIVPNGATSTAPISVTLSCQTPNNVIYYTEDGTAPIPGSSPVYSVALTINKTLTLEALATAPGYLQGPISTAQFTITAAALRITNTNPLPPATQDKFYSEQLTASGGVPPYSWSVVQVVAGTNVYELSTSTGLLTGTPTTADTDTVIFQVQDSTGAQAQATLSINVAAAANFIITTTSVLAGTVNVPYTNNGVPLMTQNGNPPITFANLTALPTGLSLDTNSGLFSGTPTVAGTTEVEFQATCLAPAAVGYPLLRQTVTGSSPGETPVGSVTATSATPTLAGSTILVFAANSYLETHVTASITDNVGNVYQILLQTNDTTTLGSGQQGAQNQSVSVCQNATAGATQWTETCTGTEDYQGIYVMEFTSANGVTTPIGAYSGPPTGIGSGANNVTTGTANMGTSPMTLVGFAQNTGPTAGSGTPGTAPIAFSTTGTVTPNWGWGGPNNALVEVANITPAGNVGMTAAFTAGNWTIQQAIGIIGAGGSGTEKTPIVTIPMTIQSGSGQTLSPPSNVWATFVGQPLNGSQPVYGSAAVQVTCNSGGTPVEAGIGTAPTSNYGIGWSNVGGNTGFQILRSHNRGPFVNYATVGTNVTTFVDTAANNCVNPYPNGTNTLVYAPNGAGVYYPSDTYQYQVATINAAGTGTPSATHKQYWTYGGNTVGGVSNVNVSAGTLSGPSTCYKWFGEFQDGTPSNRLIQSYNGNVGPSETGSDLALGNGGSAYWLNVIGWLSPIYCGWVGGADYLYFDLFIAPGAGLRLQIHGEIVGDTLIVGSGANLSLNSYVVGGVITEGIWQTYKVRLADWMTGDGMASSNGHSCPNGVLQQMMYKFSLQIASGTANGCAIDNGYFGV